MVPIGCQIQTVIPFQRAVYQVIRTVSGHKIIFTQVPSHGNLGDHAIAPAARQSLAHYFSDFEVLEANLRDIYRYARALRNVMGPDDLVMLLGGGNTGDLYRNEEWTRRFVINTFPDHRIISLPQTVHFTDTPDG